ncbi:MAG: heme NO-binding domain-containing protein [Chloroflexota bacterium]
MKGVIYTEFLEMVEGEFSFAIADQIIQQADLPSGGAYTTLGNYPHSEIIQLVQNLSEATGIPIPNLLQAYGTYLFHSFVKNYASLFTDLHDAFSLLKNLDNYIHVEVKKLYLDARPPRFEYEEPNPQQLVLKYHSHRPFALVAKGLIEGCIEHFGEDITLEFADAADGTNKAAVFTLTKT